MRKIKAPALKIYKAKQIARYKENNPKVSIRAIADKYQVSYEQARNAIKRSKEGRLGKIQTRSKKIKTDKIKAANPEPDSLLEMQYHQAVAQLEADQDMPADQRIALLDKLFSARKILQQVRLESHIKKTDAAIIAGIIRRYEPDASDERVITIYREELERWRSSQK
jgi:replication initiation and membrane attachment protein DnaB